MNLIKELNKKENKFWKMIFEKIKIKQSNIAFYEEEVISQAFQNILQYENKDELQAIIEYISQGERIEKFAFGSSSVVFKTGRNQEIVFKIGISRQNYKIPYSQRIMQPIFRKKYCDDLLLEVFYMGEYEKVNITEEETLRIFIELEKMGIFWGDARPDNLVILKRKNEIPDYVRGKYINLFGFDDDELTRDEFTALEIGEYVICDLDFLFRMDDPKKSLGMPCKTVLDYMEKNGYNMDELKNNFIYNAMKCEERRKQKEEDEEYEKYEKYDW